MRKQAKTLCKTRKIKAAQIIYKKISTQALTLLTMRDILQIEQMGYEVIFAFYIPVPKKQG